MRLLTTLIRGWEWQDASWHEGRVVVAGCSERQLREQPGQIAIRLDAIRLARLDERVQVGAGLRASNRIGEQPALAADGERSDRVFTQVESAMEY